jgi:hypothetical protein
MVVLDMSPENELAMLAGPASMTSNFNGLAESLERCIQFVDVPTLG